jgi:hypothetical protein
MYDPISALIWLATVVGAAIFVGLLLVVLGVAFSALPNLGLGSVMLECPHCGQQTPAQLPECKHCRRSFREEVAEDRPRALPPKLQR